MTEPTLPLPEEDDYDIKNPDLLRKGVTPDGQGLLHRKQRFAEIIPRLYLASKDAALH